MIKWALWRSIKEWQAGINHIHWQIFTELYDIVKWVLRDWMNKLPPTVKSRFERMKSMFLVVDLNKGSMIPHVTERIINKFKKKIADWDVSIIVKDWDKKVKLNHYGSAYFVMEMFRNTVDELSKEWTPPFFFKDVSKKNIIKRDKPKAVSMWHWVADVNVPPKIKKTYNIDDSKIQEEAWEMEKKEKPKKKKKNTKNKPTMWTTWIPWFVDWQETSKKTTDPYLKWDI